MTVTTGRATGEEARRRQLALLTELREIEHWRRLLSARLDLAVAAVAAVDEPVVRNLPGSPVPPFGLRELIGLPAPARADRPDRATRHEAALLPRLRDAQRDLDAYAGVLRATARGATYELLSRLDDHRPLPACAHLAKAPSSAPVAGAVAGPVAALAPVLPLRRRGRHRRPSERDPDGAA